MAQFSVNAQRFDPYKNFKFRVKWDGRYVAGVSKVGALKRTTEVVEHREGGDPSTSRKSPGRVKYEPITLERGVTHDPDFEAWANKVWNFGSGLGAEVSLKDFRKEVLIDVYNEAGQLVLSYKVFRAWVSEYQALPDLDANANAVAIWTSLSSSRRTGAHAAQRPGGTSLTPESPHESPRWAKFLGEPMRALLAESRQRTTFWVRGSEPSGGEARRRWFPRRDPVTPPLETHDDAEPLTAWHRQATLFELGPRARGVQLTHR